MSSRRVAQLEEALAGLLACLDDNYLKQDEGGPTNEAWERALAAARSALSKPKPKPKIRLRWISNGPLRPTILDVDEPVCSWAEHRIDALASDCDCEGPDCDPEYCPRFGSECDGCSAWIPSGEGALCMDGAGVYGDCCIEWEASRG
jgi:hypothetical protein